MADNIKVSVIVPIYNVEEYLRECLDSLVKQTLKEIEVVIVNDGSTDSSGDIAAEYATKYDNFHLFNKSNEGQGAARNYAIPLVKGDYVAFLDSDDYVSEDAYEKLYRMSENGKREIITGNVKRFNSRRIYNSSLHTHVFKDNIYNTNIVKNPELIYDTTSCNKLFKLEFWKENDFEFPEGVLYEDIPLTIISYIKSTSIAILKDTIYYWRKREGDNKSSTQQRIDINNFKDRLFCLKIVDRFIEENVRDKTLIHYKYFKWLDLDIKLYINNLDQVDEEYITQFIPIVQGYIKNIPKYVFEDLNAINRIKYYFIKNGNIELLLETLDFEKNRIKYLEVVRKGTKYFGKFPFKGIPQEYFEMTNELNNSYEVREINKIKISKGILNINGYLYIQRVNFDKKRNVNFQAKIVNIINGNEFKVNIKNIKIPELTQKFGIRDENFKIKNRLYNYDWSGFNINIDLKALKLLDLEPGEYKIIINLQMQGINRDIILASSIKKPIPKPYLALYNNLSFDYNALGEFCIFVSKQHSGITDTYFKNNNLYLEGWFDDKTSKNELFICGMNKQIKIPVSIKKNTFKLKTILNSKFPDIESFSANISNESIINLGIGEWFLKYLRNDKRETINGNDIGQTKIFNNNIFKLNVSSQGDIIISKNEIKTCLKSLNWEESDLNIVTCLNSNILEEDQKILDSRIRCVSKTDGNVIFVEKQNKEENGLKNCFIVKTKDKLGNNIFTRGIWEFYIDYRTESDIFSHKITLINEIKFRDRHFSTHKYLPIVLKGELCLKVKLLWSWEAKTTRKREALERFVYPLLRLLPINNKMIVFESFWEKSYNNNPRYLYEYIDKNHQEYKCIWIFNDESIKIKGNGKKIRFRSLKYFYYMAIAKYFVNNVNFPDFYEKRKNTIEIQTMHGFPLKKIGLDVPGEFKTKESKNKFIRRCKRWDYLIVANDKVADITKKCFLFDKEFLKVNYPTTDEIFRLNTSEIVNEIKEELKIPKNKKVILYAPTWRLKNKFDLMLDLKKMKKLLGEEYVLLLRLHPFSTKGLDKDLINNFVMDLSGYESIEKLYVISDALITDYSSVMFDYAILNKPMIFFVYDINYYKNLRGFNLDFEIEAPGPIVKTSDEVINEILNLDTIKSRYNEKIKFFNRQYLNFEKGNSCKRIFDKVFY